jgi:class 3 adenylate cyclase
MARRLVRTADRCVIAAGGLVGRHVGDGVVAFFLAETMGSESAAARACITAIPLRLASRPTGSDIPSSENSPRRARKPAEMPQRLRCASFEAGQTGAD